MTTHPWRAIAAAGIAVSLVQLPQASAQTQSVPAQATAEQSAPAPSSGTIPADEKPFWDSAQAFVDAYASRDAVAIGQLFTANAEFYDEFGELTVGREAIIAMFQGVFALSPEALVDEIQIERVRPLTPTVVMEEGIVYTSETASGPRHRSRYVALHTKGTDGTWRINTLKDFPRENTGRREQLEQLAWLVGQWVNEDPDSVVHTTCTWSADGNYLLREFTVQTHDGRQMHGTQRIGWDPALKKLRSWTFDSEGGFFNGLWTKDDRQWLLTSAGVKADGRAVTGTAVYTIIDKEMITWQYRSLIIGDEVQSDNQPVTMVKRPPPPLHTSR